ncbi:hypothetical protein [uncultured Azohydromonas sp.]|jgi:hypothetical protein|uniref:hypothetical protein n=1 Tax=uncultured Azohydromonas sp. TaxID=487342 RepID=UPI002607121B|nr:hypothetical protein [uncultured Azohydromonas sp.]
MISQLTRHTALTVALATLAFATRADVSEGRFSSYEPSTFSSLPVSEVQILDQEPPPDYVAVGTVEAHGKDETEVEILEQVNGLRPPGPLSLFKSPAPRADDASLALHALKMVAARYGVQALLIVESGRVQIRRDMVGHRIVAKAFRRKARLEHRPNSPK